jgi:hypothetical protein
MLFVVFYLCMYYLLCKMDTFMANDICSDTPKSLIVTCELRLCLVYKYSHTSTPRCLLRKDKTVSALHNTSENGLTGE